MEEFSLRVYRMLRSVSTAISRIGLGLAKRLDQKDGYSELQPELASLCMQSDLYQHHVPSHCRPLWASAELGMCLLSLRLCTGVLVRDQDITVADSLLHLPW